MAFLDSGAQAYREIDFFASGQGDTIGIIVSNNNWALTEWQQSVWDGAIAALDTYFASIPDTFSGGTEWHMSNADHIITVSE